MMYTIVNQDNNRSYLWQGRGLLYFLQACLQVYYYQMQLWLHDTLS